MSMKTVSKYAYKLGILASMAIAFVAGGCAWIDDIGEKDSRGELDLTSSEEGLSSDLSCAMKAFPLKFEYFDADKPAAGAGRIRMYKAITEAMRSAYLSIVFEQVDSETLEDCPDPSTYSGMKLDLSPKGCVRAYVQFDNCKHSVTGQITGSLEMKEISFSRGERIEGTISGDLTYLEQIETATETLERSTKMGMVEGEFTFVNHAGAVWNR